MRFTGEPSEKSNLGNVSATIGYRPLFSRVSSGTGKVIFK